MKLQPASLWTTPDKMLWVILLPRVNINLEANIGFYKKIVDVIAIAVSKPPQSTQKGSNREQELHGEQKSSLIYRLNFNL